MPGLFGGIWDSLTGKQARDRREFKERAKAEEAEKSRRAAELVAQIQAKEAREREERAKFHKDRERGNPAERMMRDRPEDAEKLKQERKSAPAPQREGAHAATRLDHDFRPPDGLRPAPSPGGLGPGGAGYSNPRSPRPEKENLIDELARLERERLEKMTPSQRAEREREQKRNKFAREFDRENTREL